MVPIGSPETLKNNNQSMQRLLTSYPNLDCLYGFELR